MKSLSAILIALMFSSNAMALAVKTYAGKDDHGQPCNLMLMFQDGKVNSIMVQALADESGNKKPQKVWEMMMPEQFDNLIKQSGSLKSGKFYFQAKESLSQPGIKLEKDMGLAVNLKRGILTYEKNSNLGSAKSFSRMTCVGLKETASDLPDVGEKQDPCDLETNPDLRNMCKVEAGKKNGSIPPGAVASPEIAR